MPLNLMILVILATLTFAVFYLVIRLRDVFKTIDLLNNKFPMTDDMRKQASDTIASLNERMGSLNQKAEQIKDVMKEVTDLRNLFTMPKRAGGAGEKLLEKTLHDVLPGDMYKSQYGLSAGTVDFVLRFRENIVPVDSKLSLENFNRMLAAQDDVSRRVHWKSFAGDVKKRIDETAKYILPGEKTTDFAIMYIPSESVYYEAFIKSSHFGDDNPLMEYAIRKKVYPTSPHTIYPYLVTILNGMKALKIEQNAKDILGKVAGLRNDFDRFRDIYKVIMSHIDDARKKHDNEAHGAITKLDQHISSLEQKSK